MSQEKIERWNEVDGNLDNGEKLQAFLDSTTDAYAILQLRRTDETVYERFESYEALKRQGKEPNIDHYDVVYPQLAHPAGRGNQQLLREDGEQHQRHHPPQLAGLRTASAGSRTHCGRYR